MKDRRDFIRKAATGLTCLYPASLLASPPTVYESKGKGLYPDGKRMNTKVLQEQIDACASGGGGTVRLPPGIYLTGALYLKSNVGLHLEKGAKLLGSTNVEDYLQLGSQTKDSNSEKSYASLINASGQQSVSIQGEGSIDGQGGAFSRFSEDKKRLPRPSVIFFNGCQKVDIDGITMLNAASWMQHYLNCEELRINGITVHNHCNFNNDGIDIDGCRDVIISNSSINSKDDAICIKSKSGHLCENVLVNNCLVRSFCNALKIGTETIGTFRNIVFSNCTVTPCENEPFNYGFKLGESAISIEMVDGGILEKVNFNNITIKDTGCPFFIRLGNRGRKLDENAPDPSVGSLHMVHISQVMVTTTSEISSSISGIPGHPVSGIHMENITLEIKSDRSGEDHMDEVPENISEYPTPRMFGKTLPAAAFYIRHATDLTFSNVRINIGSKNPLPAFMLDNVDNSTFIYTRLHTELGNKLIEEKSNCQHINII